MIVGVEVQGREPRGGRFDVIVDRGRGVWMERWTLDRIREAVADGIRLTEREC